MFLYNCSIDTSKTNKIKHQLDKRFVNKGLALIFDEHLLKNKIVTKKIDERS